MSEAEASEGSATPSLSSSSSSSSLSGDSDWAMEEASSRQHKNKKLSISTSVSSSEVSRPPRKSASFPPRKTQARKRSTQSVGTENQSSSDSESDVEEKEENNIKQKLPAFDPSMAPEWNRKELGTITIEALSTVCGRHEIKHGDLVDFKKLRSNANSPFGAKTGVLGTSKSSKKRINFGGGKKKSKRILRFVHRNPKR